MTNTPDLLAEPAVPDVAGPVSGEPVGFYDCRRHWHPWADEENE
jgi:hypothetical protein